MLRRRKRTALSVACACLAAAVAVGAAAAGGTRTHLRGCTLFDFGAGFRSDSSNGWIRQSSPGRIGVAPGVRLLRGMRTIKLEVRPGDSAAGGERADVYYGSEPSAPPGPLGISEGAHQWWAWTTQTARSYRPQKTIRKFNFLMDFHTSAPSAPQPGISFLVDGVTRRLALDVYGGDPADPQWVAHGLQRELVPFVPGKRYDFAVGITWSSDPHVGSIELWINGRNVVKRTHVATLWRGQLAYPKLANYRPAGAANWTNVVYDAGFRRAATRQAVMHCVRRA